MNDREKLMNLTREATAKVAHHCANTSCEKCDKESGKCQCRTMEMFTDHLIANGVTVQKWIPVSERFPPKGVFVLFQYAKNSRKPTMFAKNTMAVGRYENKMFIVDGCAVLVTHWMPIPQPPKGE